MYVCVCNGITDKQIRRAAKAGAVNMNALQAELGVATNCGSCHEMASRILSECEQRAAPIPQIYVPALA